jgi:hypothetical protein
VDSFVAGTNFIIENPAVSQQYTPRDRSLMMDFANQLLLMLEHTSSAFRYEDFLVVAPYHGEAEFLSICISLMLFGGAVAPSIERAAGDIINTKEEAFEFAHPPEKDKDKHAKDMVPQEETRHSRKLPALHVGERVVIVRTDPKDKVMAQGRIAYITAIYDHLADQFFTREFIVAANRPIGFNSLATTAVPIPNPTTMRRTIVLDNRDFRTFKNNNAILNFMRPASCCTVHQAQGQQASVIFSVMVPGKLSTPKIWYTASSRAKDKLITLTTPKFISDVREFVPIVPVSILDELLRNLLI